ncbi:DHA2 family multidrug resistance protein-like MFS transporter [Tamaricihabitans halophyticus]|uniref:DHA2 family multidrug resistance protein-like MFS transporter n=1 Tax=Tamaricihabitans halophyticus TaxID=1262583 RepID=A0A4R2R9U3_9PSEU|nr:MFS transporter [Tamaricihabitans halophyticus]TCP56451.1 DHA2 family multidrug resistance protein-like MFS transporter [Tamaricihabitans halophyticus]
MTTADTEAPERAGPREWIGLAILALPLFVLSLDVSVLFLAAPHLGADLQPSSTESLWIMNSYGFLIAGFLITMGTLGDRIGRRKLLLIGGAAFAVASVLAAFAPTAGLLIAARALLGVAGATLMPSTLALISNIFRDPAQRSFAIAIWMTTMSAGIAIGPMIGGLLLEHFWWGSVFLLAVPVMLLLLVLGPVFLPEYRDPDAGRLDVFSVALSLGTILPVVYGAKEIAKAGVTFGAVLAVLLGLLIGFLFVRRQRRLPNPLLDLRLFRSVAFSAGLGLLLIGILAINGIEYLAPQFLQLVEQLSPLQAGLWTIPIALSSVLSSLLAPWVARRVRPAVVIATGAVIAIGGFLIVVRLASDSGAPVLVLGVSIAVFGLSPLTVLTTDLVVGSAPREKAGSAGALVETSGELGVALGIATMGSVVTAMYRGTMSDSIPEGVPTAEAEQSVDTLYGASAVAGELPDELGGVLLGRAHDAFTDGLNLVGLLGAGLLVGVVVLVLVTLRHVRPSRAAAEEGARAEDEVTLDQ